MSKTVGVTFDDRLVWAYDEPLSVLLKHVIDISVERGLASDRAVAAEPIPVDEAAGWHVFDDLPPIIRSVDLIDTIPCAEVGDGLIGLVTGALPPEPPGASWFIGFPGGLTSNRYLDRFVPLPESLVASIPQPRARVKTPMVYDVTLSDGRVARVRLRRTEGRLGVLTEVDPPFESPGIKRIDSYYWKEAPPPLS